MPHDCQPNEYLERFPGGGETDSVYWAATEGTKSGRAPGLAQR